MKTTTPPDNLSLYDYVESDMEFGPTLDQEKFDKDLEQLIVEREETAYERGISEGATAYKIESSEFPKYEQKIRQNERKQIIEELKKKGFELRLDGTSILINAGVSKCIDLINNLEQEKA